jgi:LacI family repressor for deo operon, udp, cdd, tsx, nupC, and nupG
MSPPLTTIRQPRSAIGKHAMALLLQLLNNEEPTQQEVLLTPDLVVRNSVAAPSRRSHKSRDKS